MSGDDDQVPRMWYMHLSAGAIPDLDGWSPGTAGLSSRSTFHHCRDWFASPVSVEMRGDVLMLLPPTIFVLHKCESLELMGLMVIGAFLEIRRPHLLSSRRGQWSV